MKFVQTLAKANGFRDPTWNAVRLAVLDQLLFATRAEEADFILLPGGFLTAAGPDEFDRLVDALTLRAANGVGLIVGIDCTMDGTSKQAINAELPFFGLVTGAFENDGSSDLVWQQTSSTKDNAWDVEECSVPGRNRIVTHSTGRVGVLICGELFSSRARDSMTTHRPELVVDLMHIGRGSGVTPAMENIARRGRCAVAHTQHVAYWGSQSMHFVAADGVRQSVPIAECPFVGGDDFWIGWCSRTV